MLQYRNQLDNITNSILRLVKQWPSLILFLGKQSKAKALRAMFPGNSISSCQRPGLANVYVDLATVSDDYLLLIAD